MATNVDVFPRASEKLVCTLAELTPFINQQLTLKGPRGFKSNELSTTSDVLLGQDVDEEFLAWLEQLPVVRYITSPIEGVRSMPMDIKTSGDALWAFSGEKLDLRIEWSLKSWHGNAWPGLYMRLIPGGASLFCNDPLVYMKAQEIMARAILEYKKRGLADILAMFRDSGDEVLLTWESLRLEGFEPIQLAFNSFAECAQDSDQVKAVARMRGFSPFNPSPDSVEFGEPERFVPATARHDVMRKWTSQIQHFCMGLQPKIWGE